MNHYEVLYIINDTIDEAAKKALIDRFSAMVTENGVEVGEPQPNPDYISGFQRKVYQFAVEALPTGLCADDV